MNELATTEIEALIDTVTVDTLVDEDDGDLSLGDVSLREAINFVNPGGTIDFDASLALADVGLGSGTIGLELGELVIDKSLTINGLGADTLTVNGNNASRVFYIDDGDSDNQIEVVIDGLTITGGNVSEEDSGGAFGGGIFNRESLELSNSIITGNSSVDEGGGIANAVDGIDSTLKVINSTISDNSAIGDGGGITNRDLGTLEVINSTISGNTSLDDQGGGIYSFGIVKVTNSTISGNIAKTDGGGIYNSSRGDGSELSLNNSTITNNTAITGPGIFNTTSATIKNTIIAGNNGTNPDLEGDFDSSGYNIIGNGTGSTGFGAPGDLVGTSVNPIDPLLGPLQDNGGLTQTHALLAGSPAIDAGNLSDLEPLLEFDQRGAGFLRVLDGDADGIAIVDIGAYELEEVPPVEIIGTEDNDFLIGRNGADLISGLGGDDIIQGLAGNDQISGGSGNDLITAGLNNDTVTGDGGEDIILGGEGNDLLDGGPEADRILGESGDDLINGDTGNDLIIGGEGSDSVSGGEGSDLLLGEIAADSLMGGEGSDTLTGGLNNDTLDGEDGDDRLVGVDPSNLGTGEVDTLTGGSGRDTFVLGDENLIYYDDGDSLSRGESDLALITDFDSSQDFIQLKGFEEFYHLDFFTSEIGTSDADLIYDPGVSGRGEVIATLQDVSPDLNLTASSFVFV